MHKTQAIWSVGRQFPNEWLVARAGEVCSLVTKGTTPPNSEIVPGSNIPFLRVNNLTFTGRIQANDLLFVSEKAHRGVLARSIARPNDVLMNIVGPPLGKTALLGDAYPEYNLNQAILIYRVDSTLIDSSFFLHFLNSQSAQNWLESHAKKTSGQQNLTIEICKALPVPLPPLDEQKAIAHILSTWDCAIRQTEVLAINTQAEQRALMRALLSKHEKRWGCKPVGQIATRVTRKNDGGNHPILTISSTSGFVAQSDKYSRYMAGKSVENYILLEKGEFAYNKGNSRSYQFGCVFDLEGLERALVPHVYVCFKLHPELKRNFFKHLFASDYLQPQLRKLVNTGVRNNGLLNITPDSFLATHVPVPPSDEQIEIARILDSLAKENDLIKKNLEALRREKTGLIQQLLAGKRRVKVHDVVTSVAANG